MLHARCLLHRYIRRLREYYASADDKGGRENYFACWTLLLLVVTAAFTLFAGASRQVSVLTEDLFAVIYTLSLFLLGSVLDKLAARIQTDRPSLERLFRECCGMPFADYLDTLRVTAAERILSDPETSFTPEQIALKSGFASKSSFIRIFKRMQGVAPDDWREMHRNIRRDDPDDRRESL